ncbi:tetratricopeptide repeat protein [bacterium]|nr:tetratricopeptide repeat protein [bacterium]
MQSRTAIIFMLIILMQLVTVHWLAAHNFNLKPGVSNQGDVERVLGAAIREILPQVRYEYKSEQGNYEKVYVTFDPETKIVVTVNGYFQKKSDKQTLSKEFNLTAPDRQGFDVDENLTEYYDTQGISLHYEGRDEASAIVMIRFFEPDLLTAANEQEQHVVAEQPVDLAQAPGVITYTSENMARIGYDDSPVPKAEEQGNGGVVDAVKVQPQKRTIDNQTVIPEHTARGKRAFLGASISAYDGQGIKVVGIMPNSPAQHAGLRQGDIILEVENEWFYESDDSKELADFLSRQPTQRPLRFFVERDEKHFEVWIKLAEKVASVSTVTKQDYRKYIPEKMQSISEQQDTFEQAKAFIKEGNYAKAIPYLKKSLSEHPHKSREGLGICYLKLNNIEKAREHLIKAMELDEKAPDTVLFYALLHEKLNKPYPARSYYKKYLRLKHDNPQMNKFARERIYEINRKKGASLGRGLFNAFKAVTKEMKDFHSD